VKKKIYILLLFLFLLIGASQNGFAQRDSVNKAVATLQNQLLPLDIRTKKALEIIDNAITHPDCAKDGYSWYVRGFIYKDWYKTFESQNKKSKTRLDAVDYLKKANDLLTKDTSSAAKEYRSATKQTLKYLGSTFYNDAGMLLDTVNYNLAILNYEKFKECILVAEPNYNLRPREVEFKTVLADQYAKLFRSNITVNKKFFGEAEKTYKAVIALDTNKIAPYKNFALLYYNFGVDIINSMDLDIPITVVDKIQDAARENFRKALPYGLKAYSINPKDREVLKMLQGIHFSLYEFDLSDEFKIRLEKLDKEK
jgi:tetratricopeptide (TPR) repeat protein